MQTLLDEMLNQESKNSYFRLQQEILQLKEVKPVDPAEIAKEPPLLPNTVQGRNLML